MKSQVVLMFQEIRRECILMVEQDIFDLEQVRGELMEYEQFRAIQDSKLIQFNYYLKQVWTKNLRTHVSEKLGEVGKGWFNLQEDNRQSYEFSKLRKVMVLLKLLMQDTVFDVFLRNYRDYYGFLRARLADEVRVEGFNSVRVDPPGTAPLFSIHIVLSNEKNRAVFDVEPRKYLEMVVHSLEVPFRLVGNIDQLTPYIIERLFASDRGKLFISVPQLSRQMHSVPGDQQHIYGEILLYVREVHARMAVQVRPLADYLELYDQYLEVIRLRPEVVYREATEQDYSLATVQLLLEQYAEQRETIRARFPPRIQIGAFLVQQGQIIDIMLSNIEESRRQLLRFLHDKVVRSQHQVDLRIQEVRAQIFVEPKTPEDIERLKELRVKIPQQYDRLLVLVRIYEQVINYLQEQHFQLLPLPILNRLYEHLGSKQRSLLDYEEKNK